MQYLFTAVYSTNEKDGFDVHFPDLPGCRTQGKDMTDATKKAEAILSLCLFDMERHGKPVPSPQLIDEIPLNDNQTSAIVMASTDNYYIHFSAGTQTYNIEMPMWMSQVAKAANLDVSFMVQNCIRSQIGLPVFNEPAKIVERPKPVETIVAEPVPMPQQAVAPAPEYTPELEPSPSSGKPEKLSAMELYSRQVRGEASGAQQKEPAKDRHKPKYVARTVEYYSVDDIPAPDSAGDIPVEDILSETPAYKPSESKKSRRALDILLPAALLILTVVGAYIILFTSIPQNFRAGITSRMQARQQRSESVYQNGSTAEHSNITAAPTQRISDILRQDYGNADMFARIGILGTSINEPVLYGVGSDFYHEHNLHNNPSPDGAVFMRTGELGAGAAQGNIVIYGGNPEAGGQFSDLSMFADIDFFHENNSIMLVTDHGPYRWEIFSFYIDTSGFDFNGRTSQSYNAMFAERSMHGANLTVSASDRILTLITHNADNSRYVLHARLVSGTDRI